MSEQKKQQLDADEAVFWVQELISDCKPRAALVQRIVDGDQALVDAAIMIASVYQYDSLEVRQALRVFFEEQYQP